MNRTAYERAMAPTVPAPRNRAERRAVAQHQSRAERAQRRSRVRIQRALSTYKESAP